MIEVILKGVVLYTFSVTKAEYVARKMREEGIAFTKKNNKIFLKNKSGLTILAAA